jgi:hypothetical protein
MAGPVMSGSDADPPRAGYYLAVAIFLAVLAFAVLGLVRASSRGSSASAGPERIPQPTPTPRADPGQRVPTAQVPPLTPAGPTRPPSVTYLYPPPEERVTAIPPDADQLRR